MYRKVKERERQQRKEEIKTKIINKQQALLREVYRHHDTTDCSLNNIVPSESSNSFDDESVIKVRIRCIPKTDIQKCSKSAIKSDEKLVQTKYNDQYAIEVVKSNGIYCEQNYSNTKPYPIKNSKDESKQDSSVIFSKNDHLAERCKQNLRIENQMKPVTSVQEHPSSAPVLSNRISRSESKSITSDPTKNMRMQNTLSARSSVNSGHKSCKLSKIHMHDLFVFKDFRLFVYI